MLRSNDTRSPANTYYAWGVCGFLLLAVGIVYAQTLWHTLLFNDDRAFVYENPHVTPGLTIDGIRWAFTEGPFGEWYPLAPLSHMLDCQLFGLNAWGHHLVSVLIHAASSIALFLVWWRITDELWPSAFVAAVFAVHPQHVESVAWVSERKDVLSGLFFMLTLGAYLGYVQHGRTWLRYLLVAVLFALGVMSKPMIVTLPPLLLLLDFWPLARAGLAADIPAWTRSVQRPGAVRLVLEKIPLVLIAVGGCLMTLRTHATGGPQLAWPVRIAIAVVSGVNYVVQFFYPANLAAYYPAPLDGPPKWQVAGAAAILVVVSAAAVIWRRRCPYGFVGWFWYLGMLSPVLGLVKLGWIAMADRYMYLPSIGLSIALAWGAARLSAGSLAGRWIVGTSAGLLVVVLAACATRQTSFWRDDETLWTHALACTTDNAEAEVGLASALARRGQTEQALPHFRRAIQFAVNSAPFNELGLALARQGNVDEAIALFRRAVEIDPAAVGAHSNLGLALAARKQYDESREQFRRALEISPLDFNAHCGLALVLGRQGKTDEARAELELALEIDPRSAVARIDLARALVALGRIDEAAAQYRRVLEIAPGNRVARQSLDKLLRDNAERPNR